MKSSTAAAMVVGAAVLLVAGASLLYRNYYSFPPAELQAVEEALQLLAPDAEPELISTSSVCHPLSITLPDASGDSPCSWGSFRAQAYTDLRPRVGTTQSLYQQLLISLPFESQAVEVGPGTPFDGLYDEAFTAPVSFSDGNYGEMSCGYKLDEDGAGLEGPVWCAVTRELGP